MARKPRTRGFTIVEVLVVIGVLAVLIAIALPVLSHVRAAARAGSCLSNLRQAGAVTILIADEHDGLLPFWVAGLPSSPPVGRQAMYEVYAPHIDTLDIMRCPSDREAPRDNPDYTSYRYPPGEMMMDNLKDGPDAAIREVSRLFLEAYSASLLFDRERWHAGGDRRQAVFLPDGHAGTMD